MPAVSSAVEVWKYFSRLQHYIMRLSAYDLRQYGVTLPQFLVLARLYDGEDVKQKDLAEALMVTPGSVSQMLNVMEQRGWIIRESRGRANAIVLTREATSFLEQMLPSHNEFIRTQLAGLSESEIEQLLALLSKCEALLEESQGV